MKYKVEKGYILFQHKPLYFLSDTCHQMKEGNIIKFTARKGVFYCIEQGRNNAAIRLELDQKDSIMYSFVLVRIPVKLAAFACGINS